MTTAGPYYITTPIYYVNDRPHIGHCYTTLVADAAARFQRLARGLEIEGKDEPTHGSEGGAGLGQPGAARRAAVPTESVLRTDVPKGRVFFLTGTDEHADKVVTSAVEHGVTAIQWADRNAEEFRKAFSFMNASNDDFIRTTQERHKSKVAEYVAALMKSGAIYKGSYEGWYDENQEEYLTETVAKEAEYKSPVTGKPLVRRREDCYFFKLSAYQGRLNDHFAKNPEFVRPEARRNEVLGRLRPPAELHDVPVSRPVTDDPATQFGVRVPGDPAHRIYVWIDALFNYLSVVDTEARRELWPANVHVIAKDILWFHAVIWPAMLMALRDAGAVGASGGGGAAVPAAAGAASGGEAARFGFVGLPGCIYSHAYWVRDGKKMSKSLGNFVTIEVLQAYAQKYSLDAVRWYLLTQGPLGATDADFSHAKFVEVYNTDLANGIGNCASRVSNMVAKYFEGKVPEHDSVNGLNTLAVGDKVYAWPEIVSGAVAAARADSRAFDLASQLRRGMEIIAKVDAYIGDTRPFSIAKEMAKADGSVDQPKQDQIKAILCHCAEAIRIAALLLLPAMPQKMADLLAKWGSTPPAGVPLEELARFGGAYGLKPGTAIVKGDALFMRADPAEAPPA